MIRIRPSLPGDTWLIKSDLRQAEIDELAALGYTCEECLALGLASGDALTVFINDEPMAMVGVSDGVLWGVFTRAIDRHPLAFLRASRAFVTSLPEVVNYVDARNEKAVRWFRWLGFEVSEPVPYGHNGAMFHRFTNARERIAEAA